MRTAVAIPPTSTESGGIAQIARIKGLAMLGRGGPMELAEQYGSARVQKAVAAMTTGNAPELVDMQIIVGAFVQQLRNQSAFYRLLDGMVRVPFRSRVSMMAADATAWIVGEGKPIPVAGVTLDALHLSPNKAASLIVVTEELLRSTKSEQNLSLALRRAISAAIDTRFFGLVIDGDTETIVSSGNSAAAAVADVKALLDAVAPKVESSLIFVMSPEVQRAAAMLTNASGNFQFPNLSPTGGDIVGVPAMPSDEIGAGRVALMDASGLAGESGTVEIDASGHADIEMLASALQQDSSTAAGASLVSMFQTGSVAIRAMADFDAQRVRDDAVAVLTGVAWGEEA